MLPHPHLSTPLSLWRCFLDIRSPPPHAPWRENSFIEARLGEVTVLPPRLSAPPLTTHVNVEPQVVLLTDVSDLIDGVKSTVHCRTSGGVHKQRHVTLWNQQARRLDSKKVVEREREKAGGVTLTFCLASMILASRSAGMTLPLKEHTASDYSNYFSHLLR